MIIGRIYKLVSDSSKKVYIGCTKTSLAQRLAVHKYYALRPDMKKACSSKVLFGTGNVKIELLKEGHYHNTRTMKNDEKRFINNFRKCCVNKNLVKTKLNNKRV
jgi:hypothetical protein